jgi:hypothetical protein
MDIRHAAVAGFLEQAAGHTRGAGLCRHIRSHCHDHPFMPEGWDAAAGGFPAMTGNVPFLMKDVVLLAVSVYLLKQDV